MDNNNIPLKHRIAFECAKEVKKAYYRNLGCEPLPSRKAEVVQTKMALACALLESLPPIVVAETIGVDRTTTLYYRKNHESNMTFWNGYSEKFKEAKSLCDVMNGEVVLHERQNRIKIIDVKVNIFNKQIKELLEEKQTIKSKLNE